MNTMKTSKPNRLILKDWQVAACLRGDKTQHRIPLLPKDIASHTRDVQAHDLPTIGGFRLDKSGVMHAYLRDFPGISLGELRSPYPVGSEVWVEGSDLRYTVTAARFQRVQDISEVDAAAEGFHNPEGTNREYPDRARYWFKTQWDATHGPGAWSRNDWVFALTLERKPGGGA